MSSHYRRHSLEPSITGKFRDSLSFQRDDDVTVDKPDFRELDFGSPMIQQRGYSSAAATPAASGSSSSSSGSASGKPSGRSHSGELSGLTDTSPVKPGSGNVNRSLKQGHRRSASAGTPLIYSGLGLSPVSSRGGGSGATSPNLGVLPTGNICPSGRILKTGMATRASVRHETLCTGTANYGHGNIIRSGGGGVGSNNGKTNHAATRAAEMSDPEEVKKAGNEMYRKGRYGEALALYDRAISLSPDNPAYRSNRAAALAASGRLDEAVKECLEAVRFDPCYARAHKRLASLYLRLGEAENARRHLCLSGQCPDQADFQRLQTLEKQLRLCTEARKIGDWRTVISETDAAIANGADSSPQLVACKAEAFLRLHQIKDSDLCLSSIPRLEHRLTQSPAKLFGIICDAYVLCVQAQVDMALGRFENAVVKAERAITIDHSNNNHEVVSVLNNVKNVAKARTSGNELFSSGRYSEANVAYGDGLKFDAFNSVLYCNRAACWFKLGMWDKSVDDCNQALRIQPSYTKALLRRAASYGKLGRWEDAVRDYEVLRKELPGDSEVAESLQRAKTALSNLGFNNEVEEVSTLDKFKTATLLPGFSVFHFKSSSNRQSEAISPFVNTLCLRYPLVHFFKVDVEESLALAKAESIKKVPTFKIYKKGEKVKEMVCPSHQLLEDSVTHFLL
ncbi:PREDICTED: TPR repeat-containing thioredoxin TTL4-like [Camelina sativa]|uniref:TPR repeat-containing thioredoxin TTL4-like n=1 Tax=Camelina sativa TaxID=90675 RepID=A0ABM0YRG6_CAMSA|nr:PREDICTED: TPR repeat-containing thioredoxin TTL4-like [Camelina sativa]